MLSDFECWIQEKYQEIEKLGYKAEVVKSPSDINEPSTRLDLDSDNYIARITLWESGESYLEIVDVLSENMVFNEYIVIDKNMNFSEAFEKFFTRLRQ
ncbi:hypothetical protein COO91_01437 [Nostoc flagelliforme CCNUN1]|uniref:Uncharacterized protein n=1 Tax=Nostoc flagelliforme CCNUN1 TaxID=2038116 RepID=A0A2K8SJC6_9NOSO|nr:hypothetical protein [Nostoc flagelliforme]AUB35549.1 hypothetical protein COO91_01437 [Nostoc flagelliforme CCNUN1]